MNAVKCAFVMAAALCASAAAAGSLKWTGGAGTMNWDDAANWAATDGGAVDLSQANDYDFTDLPAGSTVCNSRALTVKSLTFAENQGTVTLDGTAATASSEHQGGTWTVPSGTTVDYRLYYFKEWGNTADVTLTGAGRVKFSTANGRLFSSGRNWKLYGSLVMELANTTRFLEWSRVILNESTRLVLSASNPISYVSSDDKSTSTCVDVGPYTLSYQAPNSASTFGGRFVGSGTISLSGGRCMNTATDWTDFTGILSLGNYSVTNLKAMGGSVAIRCNDNGRVTFVADETLARLDGDGTTGGVTVPSGKTLTVNATESGRRVFNGRISGEGGLVKAGAASELVLGGANDYRGATTVREGTLTAANAVRAYPPGLVNRWSFEGESGRFDDFGPGCNHLTYKNAAPSFSRDGVGGSQCVHFDRSVNPKMTLLTYAYTPFYGTNHFSVSMWFRPEEMGGERILFYGPYGDSHAQELYASLINPSASYGYAISIGGFGWASMYRPTLNEWHHLVLTQTATQRVVYVDGVRRNSKVMAGGWQVKQWLFQIGNYFDWGCAFQGDIDEVLTFSRALTADEVTALYKTPIPYAAAEAEAAVVPAPVAHWAFDDKTSLGKDTSGNGYDLTPEGVIGFKSGVSGLAPGSGGAEIVNSQNHGGFRWKGEGWPAKFPKGRQSFSVSVRMVANWECGNGSTAFSMGDMNTANRFFAVMYGGDPKVCGARYSSVGATGPQHTTPYVPGTAYGYSGAENSMIHQVWVWNASTGYFSVYADGRLADQRTGWCSSALDISDAGSILIGLRDDGKGAKFYGCIDDVQVFDRSLSADEVRALTRQLSGISAGSALAKDSPVAVESGAALRVLSRGEEVKSLSGSGSLDVATGASLKVAAASSFSGAVAGGGTIVAAAPLTLDGDGSAFVGAIETTGARVTLSPSFASVNCVLAEGCVIATDLAGTGLPLADAAGTVTLPAKGTVRIDATADELSSQRRRFVLAKAGAFAGATDFSGWSAEPTGEYFKVKFAVENGEFVLKVIPKGTILIVQ